jgi:plasmid maintenance system killer protein|tara:strand:+ start:116 stop:418 length:303 start_codon:yes stop_codon:yes gene_type:complete
MIKSFSDAPTRKIFDGEALTRKEIRAFGSMNLSKTRQRLDILNEATQANLLQLSSLHYHSLHNGRYSIDADSRKSKWRITFSWENEECTDVELVKIEDTH